MREGLWSKEGHSVREVCGVTEGFSMRQGCEGKEGL